MRRITGEMEDIAEKTLQAARRVVEQLHQNTRQLAETGMDEKGRLVSGLEKTLDLGEQIISQARRVNAGQLNLSERKVSLFDPDARPIGRGKAHRETEFGYKVRLTESAERLVTGYDVMMGLQTTNCSKKRSSSNQASSLAKSSGSSSTSGGNTVSRADHLRPKCLGRTSKVLASGHHGRDRGYQALR